jgi:hypothetical protein
MRRYRFAAASLALAALCTTGRADAVGEVYKWTDENGVVHYTDSPPEGKPFTTKEVKAPSVPAPAPAPEADATTEAPAATGTPPADAAKSPEQRNCEIARKNFETLSANENITADRNNDGVPEPLTAEQRTAELKRSESLIAAYCEPAPEA